MVDENDDVKWYCYDTTVFINISATYAKSKFSFNLQAMVFVFSKSEFC